MFHAPNQYRITTGVGATDNSAGNNGGFHIPLKKKKFYRDITYGYLQVVAQETEQWDHISVCVVHGDKKTVAERTPTWEEMTIAKDLFWDDTDECIQFHPPKKEYVNLHKYVLHIWKRRGPYRNNVPSTLEEIK